MTETQAIILGIDIGFFSIIVAYVLGLLFHSRKKQQLEDLREIITHLLEIISVINNSKKGKKK